MELRSAVVLALALAAASPVRAAEQRGVAALRVELTVAGPSPAAVLAPTGFEAPPALVESVIPLEAADQAPAASAAHRVPGAAADRTAPLETEGLPEAGAPPASAAAPGETPDDSSARWSARFDGARSSGPARFDAPSEPVSPPSWRLRLGRVAGKIPIATLALAGVNTAVFAATVSLPLEATWPLRFVSDRFLEAFSAGSPWEMAREAGTIVSASFLHANASHLLNNMAVLLYFGPVAERVWGRARLLVLYGAGAVGGALTYLATSSGSGLGASGAVFAIMASLIAALVFLREPPRPMGKWLKAALLSCGVTAAGALALALLMVAVGGPTQDGVAVATHAGAGLVGAGLGAWWTLLVLRRARR